VVVADALLREGPREKLGTHGLPCIIFLVGGAKALGGRLEKLGGPVPERGCRNELFAEDAEPQACGVLRVSTQDARPCVEPDRAALGGLHQEGAEVPVFETSEEIDGVVL
jgi:hypothetical protein